MALNKKKSKRKVTSIVKKVKKVNRSKFGRRKTFTVSVKTRLKYVYKVHSSSIAHGSGSSAVEIPESIPLKYTVHITYTRLPNGNYIPSNYFATGYSPWKWGKDKKNKQPICTTAVKIGSKSVSNEKELKLVTDELVTAAESCCLPDLRNNYDDDYTKVARYVDGAPVKKAINW